MDCFTEPAGIAFSICWWHSVALLVVLRQRCQADLITPQLSADTLNCSSFLPCLPLCTPASQSIFKTTVIIRQISPVIVSQIYISAVKSCTHSRFNNSRTNLRILHIYMAKDHIYHTIRKLHLRSVKFIIE